MEPINIIFVDDEQFILEGLRRSLHAEMSKEWKVSFALGGHEALEQMAETHFDVIVSDMMMPQMSGEELLIEVQERYPNTARIILSGQCNQSTAFRLVGSDHLYLSKPCPPELLIKTIEQAHFLKQSQDKVIEPITHEELVGAVGELLKNLLVQDIIPISAVPEILRAQFLDNYLEFIAPVLGENGGIKGSAGEYISMFLDDTEFEDGFNDDPQS